jgi:hypothetical protein
MHDSDELENVEKNAPLARYAAEYWVRHAQFEDVASRIKGMDYHFDLDKPYFVAWCRLFDIDIRPSGRSVSVFYDFTPLYRSYASNSLYYAALCGFSDLVERLMVKYPQHVNAISGYHMTPAVAALAGRHFQVAEVLHRIGSSVVPRGYFGLYYVACCSQERGSRNVSGITRIRSRRQCADQRRQYSVKPCVTRSSR